MSVETGAMKRFQTWLFHPVDATPLVAFRIAFGVLMGIEALASYLWKVDQRYAGDLFHFTYPGFGWVGALPGYGMHALVVFMGLCAFCFGIGYRYRLAAIGFFVSYTWLFLVERTAFNNHYYLICLLAFLFILVDANAEAAVDNYRRPKTEKRWVPFWHVGIFRAQIVVVYFFGGVAKLNMDWLRLHPIDHWLGGRFQDHFVANFIDPHHLAILFAYGGMVFDLSIGFLLLWGRTRVFAVALVLGFHLTNAFVFSIGVFPWLGLGTLFLFVDAKYPRKLMHKLGYVDACPGDPPSVVPPKLRARAVMAFCLVYVGFQVIFPLRHLIYPGYASWTEEGHPFAWHMKLRDKEGAIRFFVEDEATGRREVIGWDEMREELTHKQAWHVGTLPGIGVLYANHLRERFLEEGMKDPKVYADSWASVNGRPFQRLLDPEMDLGQAREPLIGTADYIVPMDPAAEPGIYPPLPTFETDPAAQ